jgi:predicted MPP superfamily phosphohydrolase
MFYLLLILGAVGHTVLWLAVINRLHGLGIHRRSIDVATAASGLGLVALPLVVALVLWDCFRAGAIEAHGAAQYGVWTYVIACAMLGVFAALHRLWLAVHEERSGVLLANHTTRAALKRDAAKEHFAPGIPKLVGKLPGNQVLDLHIHEKQLEFPRLPAAADGLRIAHITDLHMSGRIAKPYFEHVADQVNALNPDLIAITGDLVEREECLSWLPDTLGRLRAAAGVFYVLGNHDRRIDQTALRTALATMPMEHLGGSWQQVVVRGAPILLAGNELPWYGPASHPNDCPQSDGAEQSLRILLAHGPDQFDWAVEHGFDLILAGHNHGGQVRLPALGAILAPSRSGTRYAGGVFRRGQTVMHVSRGTSSLAPLRWNCPPEIALLVLRRGQS